MHEFASLDAQIKPTAEIRLNAVSSAALYGRSIFTTIAVYHSKIFQWEKHWRRLRENSSLLGINLSRFPEKTVETAILNLISANQIQNGRIRATFFDESSGGFWKMGEENKTLLLIVSADLQNLQKNLRLTVSPFPINSKSSLVSVKSGNYLENILALEECRRRGFDEAVCLNEKGETVSSIMANLFWISDKKIYTAPLETGALRGTTREWVLENFSVSEGKISLAELKSSDEIFLTSAGLGVAKVEIFNGKEFNKSSFSSRVQEVFNKFIQTVA